MSFTYAYLTAASEPYYQKMLVADAAAFFKWRARGTYNHTLSLETAFRRWWMACGRTGFKRYDEAFRYRRELLAVVSAT